MQKYWEVRMNKFSRQQEIQMKRQVLPWMERRNLPPVLFDKLQPHNKVLLHSIICVGKQQATDRQLRALWKDLGLSEGRGGSYYPTEELNEFFRPDGTPYQKMF